ncbi:uncharacterized protein LOC132166366 isoform X3 [Corylus avellana]|nr:uncharacterized protein LOC132166366 isoform X3 [Corylus avellana]
MKLFMTKHGRWFYWCPLGQHHGRCCIWVDEYHLEDVSQEHHRSCIWADEYDDSEEVLQDHHNRRCISAVRVDEYNPEDVLQDHRRTWGADEHNPEELWQRAQVGWQATVADKTHWLDLFGCCGCGVVMGLLLLIVFMLFVIIV